MCLSRSHKSPESFLATTLDHATDPGESHCDYGARLTGTESVTVTRHASKMFSVSLGWSGEAIERENSLYHLAPGSTICYEIGPRRKERSSRPGPARRAGRAVTSHPGRPTVT